MLNDSEVKRFVDVFAEYKDLVAQSGVIHARLESLQKHWNSLGMERDRVRKSLDSIHSTLSQLKVDYQGMMKTSTDLSSTEDTVLENVKFLIDELSSIFKKDEVPK